MFYHIGSLLGVEWSVTGPVDPVGRYPLLHCYKVGPVVQGDVIWDPLLVNQISRELSNRGIGTESVSNKGKPHTWITNQPQKNESLLSLG